MNIKKIIPIIVVVVLIISSIFIFLILRKDKKTDNKITPNTSQTSTEINLEEKDRPYVSLIPRADGRELKLKITNIIDKFTSADYELIYTAEDEGLEIEKGAAGTIDIVNSSLEKDLLLGTSSCTNGCKYKYDDGVTGGVLTIVLTTDKNEYVTFETPFILRSSSQINKAKGFSLNQEEFEVEATVNNKSDFYIAIKNFKNFYSVFSNGKGEGKIISIKPDNTIKENMSSLIGDYIIN